MIFSILGSLLLPALKRAREQAQAIQCVSNLRQVGQTMLSYAQDYDGVVVCNSYIGAGSSKTWDDYLNGSTGGNVYLKEKRICFCPSAPPDHYIFRRYIYGTRMRSGMVDPESFYPAGYNAVTVFVNLASLSNPAGYWLMMDSIDLTTGMQDYQLYVQCVSAMRSGVHLRHHGGANVLFADMHIEWCESPQLKKIGLIDGWAKDLSPVAF